MRHLYRTNGGDLDWYIADSPAHALELARAHLAGLGITEPDPSDLEIVQEPDDKVITLRDPESRVVGRRRAAAWARREPPGHFASSYE